MPAPTTPVGKLIRLFHDDCFPDPLTLAETGIDAALRMFASLFSPDPKELFHQLTSQTVLHTLREDLEDVTEGAPDVIANARNFLFGVGAGLEVASWWAFIGSVLAEGLFDWTSQVYRFAGCEHKYPPGYGYSPAVYGAWPDRGNWGGADFVMLPPSIYGPVDPSLGAPFPGHRLTAWGFWIAGRAFDGHPVAVDARVRNHNTGEIIWSGSSDPDKPGQNGWIMNWIEQPPGGGLDGISLELSSPGEYPLHEVFPAGGSGGFIASVGV